MSNYDILQKIKKSFYLVDKTTLKLETLRKSSLKNAKRVVFGSA